MINILLIILIPYAIGYLFCEKEKYNIIPTWFDGALILFIGFIFTLIIATILSQIV